MTPPLSAIILAAGYGTRMHSAIPKVLHRVAGRSLLDRAIDAAQSLGCDPMVVVAGAHSPAVGELATARGARVAVQDPPLGTGHAVLAAREALADFDGRVIITTADAPLLSATSLRPLVDLGGACDLAVLGFDAADPGAYGRMICEGQQLARIVEAKDATDAERAVTTCNAGIYVVSKALLFDLLAQVGNANAKGEYYLTDIVGLAVGRGLDVRMAKADEADVMGVNSRAELAVAEAVIQQRLRTRAMAAGVTLTAPDTVFLSEDTQFGTDVTIEPYVVIGPQVTIASGAVIRAFSTLEGASVGSGAEVGPYARLRPGAVLGAKAKVGNFVEVKNVQMGIGAKANHLSYLGDGIVGDGANIGAGTIFCNYDGFNKYQTRIGSGAFIGSNSALVAPVSIGDGAFVGSGSVITRDVPVDSLALGRGEQTERPGWAARFRALMSSRKASKADRT